VTLTTNKPVYSAQRSHTFQLRLVPHRAARKRGKHTLPHVPQRVLLSPKHSLLFDLATAGIVALLAIGVLGSINVAWGLQGLAMAAALVRRRRHPTVVFTVIALLAAAQLVAPGRGVILLPHDAAVLIAMYGVVKYADRLLLGVLAGAVSLLGALLVVLRLVADGVDLGANGLFVYGLMALATVGVWLLGLAMRTRHLYVLSLEERTATAERERDHLARIAVAEERARIARELHDMVAHSLSVMIVHADGATVALDAAPERAREALRTVSATGRAAMVEMRQLVEVLRGSDDAAGHPRALEGLAEAVDRGRSAGLPVHEKIEGTPDNLSAGVELAVYRIVQEAVTNALKHAGEGATATLRIVYSPTAVAIDFEDDGGGRTAVAHEGGGHGLIGMRERAALYGGRVEAGPRAGGGWRVSASIPLGQETS
jgi:signal transduction histidine kinase